MGFTNQNIRIQRTLRITMYTITNLGPQDEQIPDPLNVGNESSVDYAKTSNRDPRPRLFYVTDKITDFCLLTQAKFIRSEM